jgi:cysteine-rich repeat protein
MIPTKMVPMLAICFLCAQGSACTSTPIDAPVCGDGQIAGEEECDDGNPNDHDACTNRCQFAVCGDGILQTGTEACDDGNAVETDNCLQTCLLPSCGDGFEHAGHEQCDDGNQVNTDACTGACEIARCGDGAVWVGVEDCDDGNTVDNDGCSNECVASTCGDGVRQGGELCDDGNDQDDDACRNDCSEAFCGDGIRRTDLDRDHLDYEHCDDGNAVNTDNCLEGCREPYCGDGYTWEGREECDDGEGVMTDTGWCRPGCLLATCGDGAVRTDLERGEPGFEECDDGNTNNSDRCNNSCAVATCGDGQVNLSVLPGAVFPVQETCDDGNVDDTDDCPSTCQDAVCGDRFVWTGHEGCDDGNTNDLDACRDSCALATCGDGVRRQDLEQGEDGHESCDEGEDNGGAECSLSCRPALEAITTGGRHACAMRIDGTALCWGNGTFGQLGSAPLEDSHVPRPVTHPVDGENRGLRFGVIAAGGYHTCATAHATGAVYCWGWDEHGALGDGPGGEIHNAVPQRVGTLTGVTNLAAGDQHSCAIDNQGAVHCWGAGTSGQLGNNHFEDTNAPVRVHNWYYDEFFAHEIAAGMSHTCAVYGADHDQVACWGNNENRQVRDSADGARSRASQRARHARRIEAIAAGEYHTCIRDAGGTVLCWGGNYNGQVNPGNDADEIGGSTIPNNSGTVRALAVGRSFNCRVSVAGVPACWGQSYHGALGMGDADQAPESWQSVREIPEVASMLSIAAGNHFACGLTTDREVHCWGQNHRGQAGFEGEDDVLVPSDRVAIP